MSFSMTDEDKAKFDSAVQFLREAGYELELVYARQGVGNPILRIIGDATQVTQTDDFVRVVLDDVDISEYFSIINYIWPRGDYPKIALFSQDSRVRIVTRDSSTGRY